MDIVKATPFYNQLTNDDKLFLAALVRAAGFSDNDYDTPGEWIELLDGFAMVATRFREWMNLRGDMIYRRGTSDRIRELLEANNREVGRRRALLAALGTVRGKCWEIEGAREVARLALDADREAGKNEPSNEPKL